MKQDKTYQSYTWTMADGSKVTVTTNADGVTEADIMALYDADRIENNNARKARRHLICVEDIESVYKNAPQGYLNDACMETKIIERLDALQDHKTLMHALAQLTEEQRLVLEQVYVERLSLREIARREGVHFNTIYMRLERVQKKLRKFF